MKRIISFALVAVLMVALMIGLSVNASAESLYIKKVVSVVYDDSGSMTGDKWAYANYAMQAFCSMLNSEDQLYITYMSDVSKSEKIDLSSGGIQSAIDKVRDHNMSGNTPYASVEKAFDTLKNVKDDNVNTEYWLVVITDGGFNELPSTAKQARKQLNKNFEQYVAEKMPNGTNPQITFLGIAEGKDYCPDQNEKKGIYTYKSDDANSIMEAMAEMADNVSGRTRLENKDIKQVDENTLRVTSSIPLLNIAVLSQGTDAKIVEAIRNNEDNIPISRSAQLAYQNTTTPKAEYEKLSGSAYLLGDSQKVIGSGEYDIKFDKKANVSDVVVLFEPALETRMTLKLNGNEIKDYKELENAMEGDKISVSCKVYEMGTTKEVDPKLLPPQTEFLITVSENGKVVEKKSGENMELDEYTLKNIETEVKASVIIKGFNPIEYSEEFTPTKYVPRVVYTIDAKFKNDVKSIKVDNLASNTDMALEFTILADGQPITDVNSVKALNPQITVSPAGNSGAITYSNDGKIVYTPNTAPSAAIGEASFDVDVTCTINEGVTTSEKYTVLLADFEVIATDTTDKIAKNEFFGNNIGPSFYVTKDGVKLTKTEIESAITVTLDEKHEDLKVRLEISEEGDVKVIPYAEENQKHNWFINWIYYFGLTGKDVEITFASSYGTEKSTIDVVEASWAYRILQVYLPFVIELAILLFIIYWIYCILAKPKFLEGASIYIGDLSHSGRLGSFCHQISSVQEVKLKKYNKLKYRWKPTLNTEVISVGSGRIRISAADGGAIKCHSSIWYKGDINPMAPASRRNAEHPADVKIFTEERIYMKIKVIKPYSQEEVQPVETLNRPDEDLYYVCCDMNDITKNTIETGVIFAYSYTRE